MSTSLDNYTDAELRQMLSAAYREMEYEEEEEVTNFEAFCAWLELVGLAFISNALKLAVWAYERIKRIWQSVFGHT